MQFHGPTRDSVPVTIAADHLDYLGKLEELTGRLSKISSMCRPGVSGDVLDAALVSLAAAQLEVVIAGLRRK